MELLLLFQGPPRPPLCLRFQGSTLRYLNPDERSTARLVRRALALAVAPGQERESTPGILVSQRGLSDLLAEARGEWFHLREDGKDIRGLPLPRDVTFLLSDHLDLTSGEDALVEGSGIPRVSLGPSSLHADHCIAIAHNELDRREGGG